MRPSHPELYISPSIYHMYREIKFQLKIAAKYLAEKKNKEKENNKTKVYVHDYLISKLAASSL